jgi:hypothetical protein
LVQLTEAPVDSPNFDSLLQQLVDAVTHHVGRRTSTIDMFEQLDFIYQPSRNAAADLEHYVDAFGAEPVFAIERFGTRVAMVRLTADSPGLLFAEHLAGDQAILIFRVASLEEATAQITESGGRIGDRFEMPYGVGAQLILPGPQRLAIYEATHAERGRSITGRRDF